MNNVVIGAYLEDFINSVSTLSFECRKLYKHMRQCDACGEEILSRLPTLSRSHVALLRESLSRGEYCDESMLHKIKEDLQNLRSLGEEKLTLAKQVHVIVERCINQLDEHMDHYDKTAVAKQKPDTVQAPPVEHPSAESSKADISIKEDKDNNIGLESLNYSYTYKYTPTYAPTAGIGNESESEGSDEDSEGGKRRGGRRKRGGVQRANGIKKKKEEISEVVDTTQPSTYCICHQNTEEQMIACDTTNCPHGEWFHLKCVELTAAPEGEWVCPWCRQDINNKTREQLPVEKDENEDEESWTQHGRKKRTRSAK